MRARKAPDAPEALVLTIVLVAAADGGMSRREMGVMQEQGQDHCLPSVQLATSHLKPPPMWAVGLLNEEDGLQRAAQADARRARSAGCQDRRVPGLRGRGGGEGEGPGHSGGLLRRRETAAQARFADRGRRGRTRGVGAPPQHVDQAIAIRVLADAAVVAEVPVAALLLLAAVGMGAGRCRAGGDRRHLAGRAGASGWLRRAT